jgi:hypothetical protein
MICWMERKRRMAGIGFARVWAKDLVHVSNSSQLPRGATTTSSIVHHLSSSSSSQGRPLPPPPKTTAVSTMKRIAAMVLLTALLSLLLGGHNNGALAFSLGGAPVLPSRTTSTSRRPTNGRDASVVQLHLFGGANKAGGAGGNAAKEPGMMERLAMIQKAQQMMQKKKLLDDELAKVSFQGSAADGKVTITIKFIPPTSPMDPTPDYAATGVDVDEEYFATTSATELSTAFKQAYVKGIENTNEAIAEKYKVMQEDMVAAMEGFKPKQ